ncbi:MAG TPA: hypothetical protein VJM31_15110 [Vicinamibacterales bacterium]|nr:hypothetical protein [Vicinamibacterales bacterium]
MFIAVLRMSASDEQLDVATSTLGLCVDARWKEGEPRHLGGRPNSSSGLNATLADAASAEDMVRGVSAFAQRCKDRKVSFASHATSAVIDVGLGVETLAPASVVFSDEQLALLASIHINLQISAYPVSVESDA